MEKSIVMFLLLACTLSMKFSTNIAGLDKYCFFEVLQSQQKYSIQTVPKNQPKYELQISNGDGGRWTSIYYKMTTMSYERVEIHKLASSSSTYSFCIKNLHREILQITIKFQSGLQLLQFELLPDKSDAQNLEREITWMQNQKQKLYESVSKMQGLRSVARGVSNIMSKKMIAFAILGLIIVLAVNLLFYREMKRTFKERKLI